MKSKLNEAYLKQVSLRQAGTGESEAGAIHGATGPGWVIIMN